MTVLGCATSTGVPVLGCNCGVCYCAAEENRRTRSSALVETAGLSLLIDTSPDFRAQALRENISSVSAVLYTHSHADHTGGIDDLKPFTDFGRKIIECYANPATAANLKKNFGYIFGGESPGEVKPNLLLKEIDGDFSIGQTRIVPVEINHGSWKILGYRIGNFAYLTDCNGIPPESMKKLSGLELLIISSLRYSPHPSHFNLEQTLEHIEILAPRKAVLTHMSCKMGYFELKTNLPANVEPARDGAVFEIQSTGGETVV